MADTTSSATLGAAATVTFFDEHRPDLPSGRLRVTATQTFSTATAAGDSPYTATALLEVGGPRLRLDPSEVLSVYPPPGARGAFHETLPHVVLQRSTLPWARTAAGAPSRDAPPWLAVVLVAADDTKPPKPAVSTRTAARAVSDLGLPPEHGDDAVGSVVVLTVPVDTLAPDAAQLAARCRLLTHVRVTQDASAAQPPAERAVVLAARFPPEGSRVTAHLVSVEHQLDGDDATGWRWRQGVKQASTVDLVSLHSWDFFCQQEDAHSFTQIVTGIGTGMLAPDPGSAQSGSPDAQGFVTVEHQLRDGGAVPSWYHGPLLPGRGPLSTGSLTLPVRRADELLLFEERTGQLDVSYAAAWELGRLIALRDNDVATSLDRWKRSLRHADRMAARLDEHGHLAHVTPSPLPVPPFGLDGWFTAKINGLGAVPFRYLVPDGSALPPEALRFFTADPAWIACLRDGAFSIGRAANGDRDRQLLAELTTAGTPVSGFLLRSDLLRAYPGTLVDAYSAPHDDPLDPADLITPTVLRRLGPQVLLALYREVVSTVILHGHPETLHHGLHDGEAPWGDVLVAAGGAGAAEFALDRLAAAPRHVFGWGTS